MLGLTRSNVYYRPVETPATDLRLMRLIDEQYPRCPFYGRRRMTAGLARQGPEVGRQRVRRLLRVMGLEAIYPKPRLSAPGAGHRVYPYLLRDVAIERPGHVWRADITSLPLPGGFVDLAATIDWSSRLVVAGKLSNTLDGGFCQDMPEAALSTGTPAVFNTAPGVQFTARAFTERVERAGSAVSMDGRGRCLDNVFVGRLWRSVKYEDVYIRGYESVPDLERGLAAYVRFYNTERLHQSLDYRTPAEVHAGQGRKGTTK